MVCYELPFQKLASTIQDSPSNSLPPRLISKPFWFYFSDVRFILLCSHRCRSSNLHPLTWPIVILFSGLCFLQGTKSSLRGKSDHITLQLKTLEFSPNLKEHICPLLLASLALQSQYLMLSLLAPLPPRPSPLDSPSWITYSLKNTRPSLMSSCLHTCFSDSFHLPLSANLGHSHPSFFISRRP